MAQVVIMSLPGPTRPSPGPVLPGYHCTCDRKEVRSRRL